MLAYSNSLFNPFVFDDQLSIVENPQIRQWWRFGDVLFPARELPTAGRPLVNLSFAINYAVGGLNVFGYHLVNLGLHLFAGLLVLAIVQETLNLPVLAPRFAKTSRYLALAVALLWTLHPLNTEAVDYVTERTELMMGVFYLLTLYAAIRAWVSRRWRWSLISVLSCVAGMACKESMATAPVAVVLFDAIFIFESFKRALATRWRLYTAFAASWIPLGALLWLGPRAHSAGFSTGVSSWTYLLNQTVMITRYLRLAVWPRSLVVTYGWPVALTLGDVLPYALFVAALAALTVVALVWSPRWGFLGAWFFLTLAPTSSLVPIATEVGAERRMYLPLVALVAAAVVAVTTVSSAGGRKLPAALRGLGLMAIGAVSVLLFAGTVSRNREYRSALVLAQSTVDRYPTSLAHQFLGGELLAAGDREAGIQELRKAVPGDPRAYYMLAIEVVKDGRLDESADDLRTFLREEPMLLEAVPARELLGEVLARQQRWNEAIEQSQMVLRMNPTPAQQKSALTDLGIDAVATQNLPGAIAAFRQAAEIEPTSSDAQRNLANALYDHGDVDEALEHARQAIALGPGDAQAHDLLGRTLALEGKFDEARAEFERAIVIDPSRLDARDDLGKLQTLVR